MEKLISIENLELTFFQSSEKRHHAIKEINFQIRKNETLCLVGESGSGKTLTGLSIIGLLPRQKNLSKQGKILYHHENKTFDLLTLPDQQMQKYRGKHISMIFQEPMTSLNPVYKCGRQVREVLMIHTKLSKRQATKVAIELLREVQLFDPKKIYYSYPHEISGGQKQRVMIAMAIACNPDLLIADEPTTALDVTVQKNILELLRDIQRKHKMSILFITHDLSLAYNYSDRTLVMHEGEIVEQSATAELFAKPSHPYTKGLIACKPPENKRYKKLPTIKDFIKKQTMGSTDSWPVETKEERESRHEQLYQSGKKILASEALNVCFKVKKNAIWEKNKYFHAVKDVHMDIYEGETLGLVGESGCGKTTLSRTILRLIEPASGQIIYQNDILNLLNKRKLRNVRREIQIIFQDPYSSLNPYMTIGSAISEPMLVHKIARKKDVKEKVLALLSAVGLESGHYERYPHEFSGGQRQRICIARALALEPKLILCDESVSALDVSVQAQILNLLKDLKEEFNLTYLFISHDLSVVKYFSDRVMVMRDGEVVETAEADELYSNPSKAYTKKLLDAVPVINIENH